MAEESHVRLPSWVTITFVDNKAELYSESALHRSKRERIVYREGQYKINTLAIKEAHKMKIYGIAIKTEAKLSRGTCSNNVVVALV